MNDQRCKEVDLGLIIRRPRYQGRSARRELDHALAAAALDWTLEVYFVGSAVLQLAAAPPLESSLLPAGYRGWPALTDMVEGEDEPPVFAEPDWLRRCDSLGMSLLLNPVPLPAADMRRRWSQCGRVILL